MPKRMMPWLRFIEEGGEGGGSDSSQSQSGDEGGHQKTGEGDKSQTFTQADVDKIVRERVQRERAKYADYNDLKAKASESKTLEDRLADMERRSAEAEAKALRSDIAARYGINADDRDLFLTGADEETLTAQAKRLAQREVDRKKRGGVAPKEGGSADIPDDGKSDLREFTRSLFGSVDD